MISLWLAVFMLFTFVACGNNSGNEDPTETQEDRKPVAFTPTEEYVIVRGDLYASNEDITDACYYLKKAIEKAYGFTPEIVTDQTAAAGKKEILVGNTNRAFSKKVSDQLSVNDYAYSIPTASAIVICGGTPDKTLEAVETFCKDLLTYDGKKAQ